MFFLFLGPGLLREIICSIYAPHLLPVKDEDTYIHIAKYVVFSLVIDVICISILNCLLGYSIYSIYSIEFYAQSIKFIVHYVFISIICSAILSIILIILNKNILDHINSLRDGSSFSAYAGFRTVWEATTNNLIDIPINKCIAFLYSNNLEIAHGIMSVAPAQFDKEHAFMLAYTDWIDKIIEQDSDSEEEKRYIGRDIATYVNVELGYKIVFRYAPELIDMINTNNKKD